MKKILLPALLVFTAPHLSAQTTDTQPSPRFYKHEIGLFGQAQAGNNEQYFTTGGFQYRRMRNEHLSMRVSLGRGLHNTYSSRVHHISGDTLYTRRELTTINLPVLGFGLEAQRHFHKHISLFAAVELRGGYGKGTGDTSYSKLGGTAMPGTEVIGNQGSYDAGLTYFGATASIGGRAQFKRISFALELIPVQMAFTKRTGGVGSGSGMDFNMGSFSQRLSIGWRF